MVRGTLVALSSLVAVLALVIATPVPEYDIPKGLEIRNSELDPRGAEVWVAKVVTGMAAVMGIWFGLCQAQEGEMMANFTKSTHSALRKEFPDKNIMFVHAKHSQNFVNSVHYHYELDLQCFWRKAGYDAYVFDSGDFELKGDGGFENWAFSGNHNWDHGRKIHFEPIVRDIPAPPPPPAPEPIPVMPTRTNPSSTDGNYLVDCKQITTNKWSSGIAYYKNINPDHGNYGQLPDDYVDVTHGSETDWARVGNRQFPSSKVTVSWQITGGYDERQVNEYAGSADNTYWYWNVYYYGKAYLYTRDGWSCYAQYYMF